MLPGAGGAVVEREDLGHVLARVLEVAGDRVDGLLGEVPPDRVSAALVGAGVPLLGLDVRRPSLEQVFVELTGEGFDVAR